MASHISQGYFAPFILSLAALISVPAASAAQEIIYHPLDTAQEVARGNVQATSYFNAAYVSNDDACQIAYYDWGWDSCDTIDLLIFDLSEDVNTVLINLPTTEGYNRLDDWSPQARDEVQALIQEDMQLGLKAQSEALGVPISFQKWTVKPTLNTDKKFMYYATTSVWDGAPLLNVEALIFDRRGSISFQIVPNADNVTSQEAEAMIIKVLDQYQPHTTETYAAFEEGDKVAAAGAVGALAAMAGVKYGKAGKTGLVAAALLFLKKAWFVLLLPFVWLKNLFTRKR